jgi:light-regulated signal transduction histidine kinase (bacteriophytochrome)
LAKEYASALREYVSGSGEAALMRAYELGREAAGNGVGVLEMAMFYHDALRNLPPAIPPASQPPIVLAAQFFAESLSPFEMTHRGFREANTMLEQLNHELRQKNQELEQTARVLKEAKEAADAANRELEAFSYSVSHDLRSPLRAIDGFSAVLLEDYAGNMDEKGRHYLHGVRSAAQRMAELIDDLLQLSRINRADLHCSEVNLSEIVRSVSEELQHNEPDRKVIFVIQEGLLVEADSRLMRVLFDNLIGNAWKFTAKTAEPRIEFGGEQREANTLCFVRDNGAGFDMAYAQKLFSPFQRLHNEADFPGTGIGLATVYRIVDRHGGRVWAEGAVGRGATVSFTIPPARIGGRA